MNITVLLLAAGRSQRFGSGQPKQFLPLAGKPIVLYSLEFFSQLDEIDKILLIVQPDFRKFLEECLSDKSWPELWKIVVGGELRQDSVYNGLRALEPDTEIVVIHDSVRPFPPEEATRQAIQTAKEQGAAILALPATDTVKSSSADLVIEKTLERKRIWLAQTPQVFRYSLIMEAYEKAVGSGQKLTDDAMAVELLGHAVRIIPSVAENIKITYPWDAAHAQAIIDNRSRIV